MHGWIFKGCEKALPTTAKQKRVHYLGSLELQEAKKVELVTRAYPTINGEAIVHFIGELLLRYESKKKLYLVMDQAGYHRCGTVKNFLLKLGGRVEIIFLPPYSPNLNAIERVWKIFRENVTYNRYYATFKEFSEAVKDFFERKVFEIPDILGSQLNDHFQIIQPDFIQV